MRAVPASAQHGLLVELLQACGSQLPELLLGWSVAPTARVLLRPERLTAALPKELRVDLAAQLSEGGRKALLLLVEVQLRRDRRKRLVWPLYVAAARWQLGEAGRVSWSW